VLELEPLITSRTRIKMLLKFFSNSHSSAYLREMAEEFGESTNSIRHELNKLSKAGYLIPSTQGRTIAYRANTKHLLYEELKKLVHKYLGFETIMDSVVNKVVDPLGVVERIFIMGDYAHGKDSGIIDLVLVGAMDQQFLQTCIQKAEGLINRRIRSLVLSPSEFESNKQNLKPETAIWLWGEQPGVV
jgi:predicted transcriptional regulator